MQENFYVEEERPIVDIVAITLDAAVDARRAVGNLTLIVVDMCPANKARSHLVQIERRETFPWSIRKYVGSDN